LAGFLVILYFFFAFTCFLPFLGFTRNVFLKNIRFGLTVSLAKPHHRDNEAPKGSLCHGDSPRFWQSHYESEHAPRLWLSYI